MPNAEAPGMVTLIFRNLEKRWRDEHPLNIAAAIATSSNLSHVEIALGDESGANNEMCNVVRIFNDNVRGARDHCLLRSLSDDVVFCFA